MQCCGAGWGVVLALEQVWRRRGVVQEEVWRWSGCEAICTAWPYNTGQRIIIGLWLILNLPSTISIDWFIV